MTTAVDVRRVKLPDRLLDAGEVAAILGVSRRHVEDMARRREIPFLRIGRFVRFRSASIADWIEEHENL